MCLNIACEISANIRLVDVPETKILNIECEISVNIRWLVDVPDKLNIEY